MTGILGVICQVMDSSYGHQSFDGLDGASDSDKLSNGCVNLIPTCLSLIRKSWRASLSFRHQHVLSLYY